MSSINGWLALGCIVLGIVAGIGYGFSLGVLWMQKRRRP